MIFLFIYLIACFILYLLQERFIFFPNKLPVNYPFSFASNFQEYFMTMEDGVKLNVLHFKQEQEEKAKGVIFYLHGNSKSLAEWGNYAPFFLELGYDFVCYDYRGFGKSEGRICSQSQLFKDAEKIYEWLEERFNSSQIILDGYSIGSGIAAYLANKYQPKVLILEAPYYRLSDIMRKRFSIFPTSILKYKFPTNDFLAECKIPVYIFHGDKDEQISVKNSFRLHRLLKRKENLFILKNQPHNDLRLHPDYQSEMKNILKN